MKTLVISVAFVLLGATAYAQAPAVAPSLATSVARVRKILEEQRQIVAATPEYRRYVELETLARELETLAKQQAEPAAPAEPKK